MNTHGFPAAAAGMSQKQMVREIMKNPQAMAMFQERMDELVGKSSGYVESLPKSIQKRIRALKKLNVELVEVQREFQKAQTELEKKYLTNCQPLFNKRAEIVTGTYEPTESEFKRPEPEFADQNDLVSTNNLSEKVAGIPEFWLKCLDNDSLVSSYINSDSDRKALAYCTDIQYSFYDNQSGFQLNFFFDIKNPYFENTLLTKKYFTTDGPTGESVYERAEGCKIVWKEGMRLTVDDEQNKVDDDDGAAANNDKMSFFDFFNPPCIIDEDGNVDRENIDNDIMELLVEDYEIGEIIKDQIIPNAINYFFDEVDMDADYSEGEEDYDSEEGSEVDSDDVDEEIDADAVAVGAGAVGPDGKPSECQNQQQ